MFFKNIFLFIINILYICIYIKKIFVIKFKLSDIIRKIEDNKLE